MPYGAGWQRCRVHFVRNALALVPKAAAKLAALNVSVHAAETSIETLTERYLPLLLETADAISADWTMLRTRPQITLNMA